MALVRSWRAQSSGGRVLALLLVMALLTSACSSDGEPVSSSTSIVATTATSVSTTTPSASTSTTVAVTTTEAPTAAAEPPTTTTAVPIQSLIPDVFELATFPATEAPAMPIQPMCPDFSQFSGLSPIDTETRIFVSDPVLGPFLTLGFLDFPESEADALLDAYLAGATGSCAEFERVNPQGRLFNLGWAESSGPIYGDRTLNLAIRGHTDGFPINSDVVLIRVGNRVGYVGYLTTGGIPDALTRDTMAAAVASILEGDVVSVVDLPTTAGDIARVLPTLEELAIFEVFDTAAFAVLPDKLCPSGSNTNVGLNIMGTAAVRFFGVEVVGAQVLLGIIEVSDGGADTIIDRWEASANGRCSTWIDGGNDSHVASVGIGTEFGDRTVTLLRRAKLDRVENGSPIELDSVTDYVLVRSGDYVGFLQYSLTTTDTPDVATRDSMVEVLVAALEELNG